MKHLFLRVEITAGTSIEEAIANMHELATELDCGISTNFNSMHLPVAPHSVQSNLVNRYYAYLEDTRGTNEYSQ